ncbi:hypothetical protein Tco_0301871, partial [Tanacetum coccineum]
KPYEPRPPLVDTTVTLIPDTIIRSPSQPPPTQPKRSKVKRILKMSKKPDTHVESAHLKNVFPKDVLDFGKIKMEKAAKKSTPKYSSTPFDLIALSIFDQKDTLFQMMSEASAYDRHPAHKAL